MPGCINEDCCDDSQIFNGTQCVFSDDIVKEKKGSYNINKITNICKKKCRDNKFSVFKDNKKYKKCVKVCRNNKLKNSNGFGNTIINEELDIDDDDFISEFDLQSQILKDTLDASITNLENAPEKVDEAEAEYYNYIDGESGYTDLLFKRHKNAADKLVRKSLEEYQDLFKQLNIWCAKYRSQTTYTERMNQLYKIKLDENKKLKKGLKNEISSTLTNDRKVIYEEEQFNGLYFFRLILTIIYYGLLIVFIVLKKFFQNKLYKNLKIWLGIALYIVFPFVLSYIPIFIFYIISEIKYLFENKAPKNVYIDL